MHTCQCRAIESVVDSTASSPCGGSGTLADVVKATGLLHSLSPISLNTCRRNNRGFGRQSGHPAAQCPQCGVVRLQQLCAGWKSLGPTLNFTATLVPGRSEASLWLLSGPSYSRSHSCCRVITSCCCCERFLPQLVV